MESPAARIEESGLRVVAHHQHLPNGERHDTPEPPMAW